jgi:hypothetical protein
LLLITDNNTTNKGNSKNKIKAVLFIPCTKQSELAQRMRESEEKMESMNGYRLKIVERGGAKLVDILHKSNPWAGHDCGRTGCLLCQDCRKRNCVYQTYCITCRERQGKELKDKMQARTSARRRWNRKGTRSEGISILERPTDQSMREGKNTRMMWWGTRHQATCSATCWTNMRKRNLSGTG